MLYQYVLTCRHRMFSGFPSVKVGEDKRTRLKEKRSFWTTEELRKALTMLGLPVSGHREELIHRFIDFLICPVTTAHSPIYSDCSYRKPRRRARG